MMSSVRAMSEARASARGRTRRWTREEGFDRPSATRDEASAMRRDTDEGRRRRARSQETGDAVSVFTFRGDAQRDRARIEIAKNGVKRLKTIRHPNVLLMKETVRLRAGTRILFTW